MSWFTESSPTSSSTVAQNSFSTSPETVIVHERLVASIVEATSLAPHSVDDAPCIFAMSAMGETVVWS